MARYIDAEKAIEYLKIHKRTGLENNIVLRADEDAIIRFINEKCETVDLRENGNGKWEETPSQFKCSVCKTTQLLKSKYCPNCGARMN